MPRPSHCGPAAPAAGTTGLRPPGLGLLWDGWGSRQWPPRDVDRGAGVRAAWGQGPETPGRRACGRTSPPGPGPQSLHPWSGSAPPGVPGSGVGPVTASVFTSCVTKSTVTLGLNEGPVLSTSSPTDAWCQGSASPPGRALHPNMWWGPTRHSSRRVTLVPVSQPRGHRVSSQGRLEQHPPARLGHYPGPFLPRSRR